MSAPAAGDALAGAVAVLAAETVESWSTHELGDELVAIRRHIDRLEAEFIRRLQVFERGQGALGEGAASTVSWLRGTCGLSAAAAVDRTRMARVLADLPETTASFAAGRAPFTNVALIARLAEQVGTADTRSVEHTLVDAAEQLDAGRMRLLTAATRFHLDAQGALDEDNRNHERRWFSCDQTYGGVFALRGELDAEGGALVRTALDALSAPAGPDDERSGSQRRADALVDLASRQLQGGSLPSVHGQRPHLVVTVPAEVLSRGSTDGLAELGGVGPIHLETARRLACDASLTVVTVAAGGAVTEGATVVAAAEVAAEGAPAAADVSATAAGAAHGAAMAGRVAPLAATAAGPVATTVGRASRTIPAPLRAAMRLRDKGCRFPRCDRPPEWTDGHHVQHWADNGDHEIGNVVLLCRRHHRMVHEHGWALRLEANGEVTVTEPPGRMAWAP